MLKKLIRFLRGSYTSAGIEVSDGTIRLINLLIRRGKTPELVEFIEETLSEDSIDDGKIKDSLKLMKTIQTLSARLEKTPDFVHFVLPSQLIMVRFLRLPDVRIRDIRRMVEFELKHNIHLPFQNPLFDIVKVNGNQDIAKMGWNGIKSVLSYFTSYSHNLDHDKHKLKDLTKDNSVFVAETDKQVPMCDVMLVATSSDFVAGYTEIFDAAKLPITTMEIKALSIMRYIEKSQVISSNATFLIVDVNTLTTDLTIYHNGYVGITRNVPINFQETEATILDVGGNEALAMAMQIARDAAFNTHCNDLAYEVERLMSFYRYSLNHQQFERFDHILLTGEMKRLKEVSTQMTRILTMDVQVIKPQNVEKMEKVEKSFSSFSIALGSALRGDEK